MQVDKYSWVDIGSSYLPSDVLAGVLLAGLDEFADIQRRRHHVWSSYDDALRTWAGTVGASSPPSLTGAPTRRTCTTCSCRSRSSRGR